MKVAIILCSDMHMDIEKANSLITGIVQNNNEVVSDYTEADVVIIMTCAFGNKKEYSMSVIADVTRNAKLGSQIIVSGCLVKTNPDELNAISGICVKTFDEVQQMYGKVKAVKKYIPQNKVIISEGCLKKCSYCVYPLIASKYVSKPVEDVLKEVGEIYESETVIYITGALETSDYGIDLYGTHKIAELIEKVSSEYQNSKYVIGWFHPAGLTDDFIDTLERCKNVVEIMLHIQHNNNDILRNMNRPCFDFVHNRISKLLEKRPDLLISTEVIVGFPGETEKEFNELVKFLDSGIFADIGVASYEPVIGTKAALLPNLPSQEVRQARLEYIKKRYNYSTCYIAPTEDFKPILKSYIEAMSCLEKLPNMFLLPEARKTYEYIAGADTSLKMNFNGLLEELLEEISEARDNFSVQKSKTKMQSIYTREFREFAYNVFSELFKSKDLLKARFKKVLLDE